MEKKMGLTEFCDRYGVFCNLIETSLLKDYVGMRYFPKDWKDIFKFELNKEI